MKVSITEYAKSLGVTRQTIYNRIKVGIIKTVDCCGVKKINVPDIGNVKGGTDSPHEGIPGAESPQQG